MKQTMKRVLAVACSAATLLSLAACGTSGSAEKSNSITFQTWNLKNDKYTPYFKQLISNFEKENEGVTIKWVDQPADGYEEKLSTDAAAGTLPDVMDMGPEPAYALAQGGALLDVNKADPKAKAKYLPAAWEATTLKGKNVEPGTYGFPWYLNSGPTYYNKALFDECGLDSNNLPKTYDELFKQGKVFGEHCGDSGKSMMAALPGIQAFGMYGVQLMNKDHTKFTFNSDKGVEFIQHYVDMYNSGAMSRDALNASWTGEGDSFKGGTVATIGGSLNNIDDFEQNAKTLYKNLGVEPLIANSNPNMYIEMLTVNAKTKNQDLAIKFAEYVTNSKNQLEFDKKASIFPSSTGTIKDEFFNPKGTSMKDDAMRMTAKTIADAKIWGPPQFNSANTNELRNQIALAVQGKQTVKQSLDNAVKFANDRMND